MEPEIQLLLEYSIDFVIESSEEISLHEDDGNKDEGTDQTFLKLTGVFQKGNTPNGNRRIYKTELLVREVNKFQIQIVSGLALGKAYHPGFFDAGVTNISHRVTKLWMDEDIVRGELLVLKTRSGKDIKAITDGGGKVGLSSRGFGSMKYFETVKIGGVEHKKVWVVDDNYRLETFDLVRTPSVETAIMKSVKEEAIVYTKKLGKGGKEPMTLEELKAKYPALYNTVHEAGVSEGKRIGETALKERDKVIADSKIQSESRNSEIISLKKNNGILIAENKDLIEKNSIFEADKIVNEIKNAVIGAVSVSEFKDYLKEEDIEDICRVSLTIEDAKKEVEARIKLIESVLVKHAGKKSVLVNSGSKNIDTSENGSTIENDESERKAYLAEQRQAAFGN